MEHLFVGEEEVDELDVVRGDSVDLKQELVVPHLGVLGFGEILGLVRVGG